MTDSKRLLYFSPNVYGGMADYAREQANALSRIGVKVDFLTSEDFRVNAGDHFQTRAELSTRAQTSSPLLSRLTSAKTILQHHWQLARIVETENYRHVLLGCYAEYLAPLWSGKLKGLAQRGVTFGVIVHDPVRDYVVGPKWWHRLSIASAYSFVCEAFVHEPVELDTIRPAPWLQTTVIPHGIFAFPPATATRDDIRCKLGLPSAAQVWLSFGHVRDGKNLDLVIRALTQFPNAYLLVAGKEQSSGQKPVEFYRELAHQCGVAQRCIWLNRYIAPEEVGDLFTASDLVLLTYSKDFRSASGVLNAAAYFQKPCLASSGEGNLKSMISKYNLGIWVEPDKPEALIAGLHHWQSSTLTPSWSAYEEDNSWTRNAEIVADRMFNSTHSQLSG